MQLYKAMYQLDGFSEPKWNPTVVLLMKGHPIKRRGHPPNKKVPTPKKEEPPQKFFATLKSRNIRVYKDSPKQLKDYFNVSSFYHRKLNINIIWNIKRHVWFRVGALRDLKG